ncbi:uncharacterized protein LOC120160160 [Hibiscus syriacus]|uniref:uncharacterized protein LOC120160160 n=1 Tax=Hibiscus syriacus TaxID=106335 RepID=UPI001921C845|nr:uncharacterized protein LOC120160160 [Hibiscus syriacus]
MDGSGGCVIVLGLDTIHAEAVHKSVGNSCAVYIRSYENPQIPTIFTLFLSAPTRHELLCNTNSCCSIHHLDQEKQIEELNSEVEQASQRCEGYRTKLMAVLKDMEEQKLKLSEGSECEAYSEGLKAKYYYYEGTR